jgi:outer membrane protein OmpA-like peptidoglycan-associated protein
MFRKSAILLAVMVFAVSGVFAQEAQVRNLVPGQKYKLKGFVVAKDDTSFVLRDSVGVDTKIQFDQTTSIRTKGGFLRSGDKVAASQIIRGLNIEVEGRGNPNGGLDAAKLRFEEGDLRTALSIDTRVAPAEERITETEQNALRLAGQIDELMEVSSTIRGEARVAQDTAEAAVTGVNATNQRISTLDEFLIKSTATVNFRVNSFVLSSEGKAQLDQIARSVMMLKGYTIEVTGFASAEGNAQRNRTLSQNRAQAVIDYLVEIHNIDLRRFTQSYGFGANRPVADNSSREGREQNRRVEVRVLVSKGLNQNVEVRSGQ